MQKCAESSIVHLGLCRTPRWTDAAELSLQWLSLRFTSRTVAITISWLSLQWLSIRFTLTMAGLSLTLAGPNWRRLLHHRKGLSRLRLGLSLSLIHI